MKEKKNVAVTATTKLVSNSGMEYRYEIKFSVDHIGRVSFISESCDSELVRVRPYQLINLLIEVYYEKGIALPAWLPAGEVSVYKGRHGNEKLSVVVADKRYRIDQPVSGSWIGHPRVNAVVKAVWDGISDPTLWELVYQYGYGKYSLLDPRESPTWEIQYL